MYSCMCMVYVYVCALWIANTAWAAWPLDKIEINLQIHNPSIRTIHFSIFIFDAKNVSHPAFCDNLNQYFDDTRRTDQISVSLHFPRICCECLPSIAIRTQICIWFEFVHFRFQLDNFRFLRFVEMLLFISVQFFHTRMYVCVFVCDIW